MYLTTDLSQSNSSQLYLTEALRFIFSINTSSIPHSSDFGVNINRTSDLSDILRARARSIVRNAGLDSIVGDPTITQIDNQVYINFTQLLTGESLKLTLEV